MKKAQAIALLGGSVAAAARAVGVSSSAVSQWPDELPSRIEDRVLAVLARRHLLHLLRGQESEQAPLSSAETRPTAV